MIKILFSQGAISEVLCESSREAAEVVNAMATSFDTDAGTKRKVVRDHQTRMTKTGRKMRRPTRMKWWNIDEMRYLVENHDKVSEKELSRDPYLMQRHVPSAVSRVLNELKSGGKFSSKRLNVLYQEAVRETAGQPA